MGTGEVTLAVKLLMDSEADQYESQRGHGFNSPEEQEAWRLDIIDAVEFESGATCLDVGAGTGVLTRLLAELVGPRGHVVACDLSREMLLKNQELLGAEFVDRVSFVIGDIHDQLISESFVHKTYDYIACRQVIGLLLDPITIFKSWHSWLKPGGHVVILDALWTRESWSGDWSSFIDRHPLACAQSLAAVPYCLQQAGFIVETNRYLTRVNDWFQNTQAEAFDCPRYIVVARRDTDGHE